MGKLTKEDLAGVTFDTFGKKKNGNYIIRQGYFYKNGKTQEIMIEKLKKALPEVIIVDSWDHWAAFRGGQSVAQGSHFWVEFTI